MKSRLEHPCCGKPEGAPDCGSYEHHAGLVEVWPPALVSDDEAKDWNEYRGGEVSDERHTHNRAVLWKSDCPSCPAETPELSPPAFVSDEEEEYQMRIMREAARAIGSPLDGSSFAERQYATRKALLEDNERLRTVIANLLTEEQLDAPIYQNGFGGMTARQVFAESIQLFDRIMKGE